MILIVIVILRRVKQERKTMADVYRAGVVSPENIDTTAYSTDQILPQYQNPHVPLEKNKPRMAKYDNVMDDDKILDMLPLRKYRLNPSYLIMSTAAPIASGANGEVWLGKLGSKQVAIKRLKKQASNFKIQKFIVEVILMIKIDCPYIVGFIGDSWFTPEDL
ncbi:hypothetical protein THRCLA_21519 [Thraustotheca clavata]|uniref:Serine-threonine/tyrosine-protein kinase catalytic domain-containing protein n=1 Tax=Thraustotheca clavata TaxID=74557 RepID=A0A1V9ZVP6_9STRA|nr:hypothetical protein THRCLA_21519 [Thraustotheca clavata]